MHITHVNTIHRFYSLDNMNYISTCVNMCGNCIYTSYILSIPIVLTEVESRSIESSLKLIPTTVTLNRVSSGSPVKLYMITELLVVSDVSSYDDITSK